MSRFPSLRRLLAAIAIASLPVTAAGCCGPAPTASRTEIIDPESPIYKPLVQACIADDLTCGDLCEEILRQAEVEGASTATFSECRIMNASATEVRMTYSFPYDCVAGRRPPGLGGRLADCVASPVAGWLAQMAHLEAAAVYAFAHTAIQLGRHRAPAALIERAIVAARQEVVHAALMAQLARAHGAEPPLLQVAAAGELALFELCRDNAVEGCVRETYGALVAAYQAHMAPRGPLRAALAQIAVEEAEHAELSVAIDRWARPRLSDEQRAQVEAAEQGAIVEVMASAARPVDPRLVAGVGLPAPETAVELVRALAARVWAPAKASG